MTTFSGKMPVIRHFCPTCDAEVERVSISQDTSGTSGGYGYLCRGCGWESGLCGFEFAAMPAAAAAPVGVGHPLESCRQCGGLHAYGAAHVCQRVVIGTGG